MKKVFVLIFAVLISNILFPVEALLQAESEKQAFIAS